MKNSTNWSMRFKSFIHETWPSIVYLVHGWKALSKSFLKVEQVDFIKGNGLNVYTFSSPNNFNTSTITRSLERLRPMYLFFTT